MNILNGITTSDDSDDSDDFWFQMMCGDKRSMVKLFVGSGYPFSSGLSNLMCICFSLAYERKYSRILSGDGFHDFWDDCDNSTIRWMIIFG